MFLLFACVQAEPEATNVASEIEEEGESDFAFVHPLVTPSVQPPQSDCDEQVYKNGLTLVNLPASFTVAVSLVTDDGEVYTETIRVDACGTATPFVEVSLEDFGGFDNPSIVYAQVVEQPEYYVYQGVYLTSDVDAPSETLISTQWEPHDDGQWYAVRDEELGVMIGIFMIP